MRLPCHSCHRAYHIHNLVVHKGHIEDQHKELEGVEVPLDVRPKDHLSEDAQDVQQASHLVFQRLVSMPE